MLRSLLRRLRGRGSPRDTSTVAADAAAAFWLLWSRLRPEVAAALDAGEPHRVEPKVADAVALLHRGLGWSLAGGGGDEPYTLVITGEGDVRLRQITDAWLAAAPTHDGWEYHDAAQAVEHPADVTLGIGDQEVALADLRVGARVDGDVLHVSVFHPTLARLSAADRDALAFVALDTALGERLVERWIGDVAPVDSEPPDAVDLVGLRDIVLAMAASGRRTVGATG